MGKKLKFLLVGGQLVVLTFFVGFPPLCCCTDIGGLDAVACWMLNMVMIFLNMVMIFLLVGSWEYQEVVEALLFCGLGPPQQE